MHERVEFVRNVRAVIATADYKPPRTVAVVELALDVRGHLAHLFVVLDVRQWGHLLNRLVGDVYGLALHFRGHIRGLDEHFLRELLRHCSGCIIIGPITPEAFHPG